MSPRRLTCLVLSACLLAACGEPPPPGTPDAGKPPGNTGDKTPPTIISSEPAHGAMDVRLDTTFAVEFSEEIDVDQATFTTEPSIVLQSADWSFGNTVLLVAPAAPLQPGTVYRFTVNATDLAGNALEDGLVGFTTRVPDTTPPALVSSTPADGATDVAADTTLVLTFSEPMDLATFSVGAVPQVTFGDPVWTDENKTVTLTPGAPLQHATQYNFAVVGKDLEGNDLPPTSVDFTVIAPPDTTAPTVVDNAPADGATGVSVSTNLTVTFSEPMDRTAVETAFALSPAATCLFAWDTASTQVSCVPSADLGYSTAYTVTVGTGAQDPAGNALAAAHSFGFTTAAAPDTTAPTVASVLPADGALGQPLTGATVEVTFSEPMDKATAQAAFSIVSPSGFNGGGFSWNAPGTVMTYAVPGTLPDGTTVSWELSTAAQDVAGNSLAQAITRTFKTVVVKTYTLAPVSNLSGWVSSDGTDGNGTSQVGDTTSNATRRGFVTFDLSIIPSAGLVRVSNATLSMHQGFVQGSPYSSLGSLLAEGVSFAVLTASTYNTSPLGGPSYTLSTSSSIGAKSVTVTSQVEDDIANRATRNDRSQFRVRFANGTDNDGAFDMISLYLSNTSLTVRVELAQ